MALWKVHLSAPGQEPKRALFLDRDGVVNAERHYLSKPEDVEILPGVAEAMIKAREAGYWLVGVSNQSGLGRGRFTADQFHAVMIRFDQLLEEQGIFFDAFFYCPHAPEECCTCRKPKPGMLHEASEHLKWVPDGSWVIGDKKCDVALGRNAGFGGMLVRTGHGESNEEAVIQEFSEDKLVQVTDDLNAAVDFIVEQGRR